MKDDKIIELKQQILEGRVTFLDSVLECLKQNKVLYSDNYGDLPKEIVKDFDYL
jgi:hypothetical protein